RPEVRVEIESLPEPHVDGLEALADRRADGTLEGDAVPADRFQGTRGQGVSLCGFRVAADEDLFPGERRARRVEDRQDGVGDFGADAVAANQRDRLRIRGAQWASRFSGAT